MIKNKPLFERLLADALQQEFSGWDFSYLDQRWIQSKTWWDYEQNVLAKIKSVTSLLDMGTGGGEFLASLRPLPADTCATEGYAPNVPIAKARLQPLGVRVFEIESDDMDDMLPFADERFELVINRHESFSPHEVYRILKKGGHFVTQQVGGRDNVRLNELLQAPDLEYSFWTLDYALKLLLEAGFEITEHREEFPETIVTDIGAVVYYLKVISWQIPDFSVETYYEQLIKLHNMIQDDGPLVIRTHRFYIEACKK